MHHGQKNNKIKINEKTDPKHPVQKQAKEFNKHFSKEKICKWLKSTWKIGHLGNNTTGVKQHQWPTPLVIWERQMETTVRSTRQARVKKSDNNKYWQGCEEIGTPVHCWQECKKWCSHFGKSFSNSSKVKYGLLWKCVSRSQSCPTLWPRGL